MLAPECGLKLGSLLISWVEVLIAAQFDLTPHFHKLLFSGPRNMDISQVGRGVESVGLGSRYVPSCFL